MVFPEWFGFITPKKGEVRVFSGGVGGVPGAFFGDEDEKENAKRENVCFGRVIKTLVKNLRGHVAFSTLEALY